MTTTTDLLSECRNDYLMTGGREQMNKLNGTHSSSTTTLAFLYDLGGITEGAKLSVELEDMLVWSTNSGTKSAVVQRAMYGTTAAAHADGSLATVNTRWSDAQILRAINHELQSLSSPVNGLFRMRSVDVTYAAGLDSYDLTSVTDLISIYGIRFQDAGAEAEWPWVSPRLFEYQRDLDTSVFASGHAIFLRGELMTGNPARVWYKAPFSPLTTVSDDVEAVSGLHEEAHDILALGAAIRLTAGREVRRNQIEGQGDTRRASEVPAGANLGANRDLKAHRIMRIQEEAARLSAMWPVRL